MKLLFNNILPSLFYIFVTMVYIHLLFYIHLLLYIYTFIYIYIYIYKSVVYIHTYMYTYIHIHKYKIPLVTQRLKSLPEMRETWVWSLGWEDSLKKGMATHSSILVWRIPWMEEPGGLQSMGSQRVGRNWMTSLSLSSIKQFLHYVYNIYTHTIQKTGIILMLNYGSVEN